MKIYIAGASKEIDLVERYVQQVRSLGYTITHDWCAEIRRVGIANPIDVSREANARYARDDLQGVNSCDLFWMLVPDNHSAGCWIEFGYALRLNDQDRAKQVLVSGNWQRSIFCALPHVQLFDTHELALEALRKYIAGETTLHMSRIQPASADHD